MVVLTQLALTPVFATIIFVIAVLAGVQYRRNWKAEGPAWKAWLFGSIAALCLIIVAFVPLQIG